MLTELIGVDPLFLTNVKLFIKDVLELEETNEHTIDTYKFFDHFIKFAEICGIIVAVETTGQAATYTIDDGSGTIPCRYWITSYNFQPIKLGTLVRVLGKVSTYRDQRQIVVHDLHELFDPNEEVLHWLRVMAYKKEYEKKFKIPTQIKTGINSLIKQYTAENAQQVVSSQTRDDRANIPLTTVFLEQLKTLTDEFTYFSAKENPIVIEAARKSLIKEYDGQEPINGDIKECIRSSFHSLIKSGDILIADKRNHTYKLVDDIQMQELIMEIITNAESEDSFGGVRFDFIAAKVCEVPMYSSNATNIKNKVKSLITNLIYMSVIYPINDKEYKVVY